MTTPTTLEQSLLDLCAKHNLTSVSLGLFPCHQPDAGYTIYLHWAKVTADGRQCATGTAGSISEALRLAIVEMTCFRYPPAITDALADETLPEMAP